MSIMTCAPIYAVIHDAKLQLHDVGRKADEAALYGK